MTEAQRGLLDKAHRALESARLLLGGGDIDGAVSRAYYSMFYVAEAALLSKGMAFSSHSAVISAFGKEFAKPGIIPAEYHRYFKSAEDARRTGDYEIESHLTEEEASEHIAHAELFLKAGMSLLDEAAT